MACLNCGHTWTGPGYDQSIDNSCPNCGYVLNPNPTLSDMDRAMRGMPDSTQDDMSGNPLMEGVWAGIDGGWQNRMKRDESFASVRRAGVTNIGGVGYHGDLHNTMMDIDRRAPGLLFNGAPLDHSDPENRGTWPVPMYYQGTIDVTHPNPKVEATAHQVLMDGHSGFWRQKLMQAAEKKRQMQMQQGVQAKVANDFDFDDLFGDDSPNPMDYGRPDGAFIVNPQGMVFKGQNTGPNPEDHSEIAARHNIRNFPDGHTLGYASTGDPAVRIVMHESGLEPQQLSSLLSRHFPNHGLPETLEPVTNEERWFGPGGAPQQNLEHQLMTPEKQYQIQQAEQSRGKPFGYYNNPWINRGGSVSNFKDNRNSQYFSWEHDSSQIAHDLEMHEGNIDFDSSVKESFLPALLGLLTAGGVEGMAARGVAGGLIRRAVGGPGGPGGQPQQQEPSAVGEGVPQEYYSTHMELTGGHPSSDDNFTERADGDPEDVDAKEINDGDRSEWQNDTSAGEGGTDALRPEVVQAMEEAMPSLLQFYNSEESGASDPAIQKLLSILEQYDPELLNEETSPEDQAILDQHMTHGSHIAMGVPGIGGMQPQPTQLMPSGNMPVNPTTQANCPHCGAVVSPGSGVCAQCGGALQAPMAPMQPGMPVPGSAPSPSQQYGVLGKIAAGENLNYIPGSDRFPDMSNQLPHPDEGWAVECPACGAEADNGSQQELGTTMQGNYSPDSPVDWSRVCWNCGTRYKPFLKGGKTAANQGPHSVEQIQAVIQALQQMGQYEPGKTETDIIANPAAYADILAQVAGRQQPPAPDPDPGAPPPAPDPSQMGGQGMPMGMPPGGGGMPMQGKVGADNAAPKCPNCGSHTTGIVSDQGACSCSRCKHTWNAGMETADRVYSAQNPSDHPVIEGTPAADQMGQDDPTQDINPGIWATSTGDPLKVGQQYEMYSALYDIPDIVKITAIKPDGIEYELQGEYGLSHRTAVSQQEAQMDGLQFIPLNDQQDMPAEPTQDSFGQSADPGQVTDESHNFPMQAKKAWTARLAGKKFTPMEQRDFIDEPGIARNSEKLDLENTHYVDEPSLSSIDDFFLW